ncbi:epigen isoform 1-T1 [Clarias gariepinus]|uniref:epigen-like n=1 Tax=Clarias gariepinus TaxID=13013 RepID=UPI00234E3346|nr:epigen-like [Clarias gariepinus]
MKCVQNPGCLAVFALASVSLLYSRTVECVETSTSRDPNLSQNRTLNEPQVPGHIVCSREKDSYCIYGRCSFHENINTTSCTCDAGYIGSRCELRDLRVMSPHKLEEVIAISCGMCVLLACVCVLSYCCYRNWGRKPALPYGKQGNMV